MGYSLELALKEEEAAAYERSYITGEVNHSVNKLFNQLWDHMIKKKIIKINRKETKSHYLYKRLDGQYKIA